MAFNRARFLIELLGPDGARALAKAASRSELLAHAIVPRTIIAWLRSTDEFSGEVPGAPGRVVEFQKSSAGFTGSVTIQEQRYEFQNESLFHAAGALAVAVGIDSTSVPDDLKNVDLERLGKSIDLMVMVQRALKLSKREEKSTEESSAGDDHGEYSRQEIYQDDKDLKKKAMGAGSGQSATPTAPAAPTAPTPTAPQVPTTQKLPKKPASAGLKPKMGSSLKLSEAESAAACPVCAQKQFSDGKFVGCLCFRALSKSVKVVGRENGVELQLGDGWDRDTVLTFLEAVGRS